DEGCDDHRARFRFWMYMSTAHLMSSPAKAGDPVLQRRQWLRRTPLEYWMPPLSRSMTAEETSLSIPAAREAPESCRTMSLEEERARGECRMQAAPMARLQTRKA